MSTPDPQHVRRIKQIEDRLRKAEARLDRDAVWPANVAGAKQVWLAKVVDPDSGDDDDEESPITPGRVFTIEFDDAWFEPGLANGIHHDMRGTQVKAYSLVGWMPEDTFVAVVHVPSEGLDNSDDEEEDIAEWWIIAGPQTILHARITERLDPGTSAEAKLVKYSSGGGVFVDFSPNVPINLFDKLNCNFGLTDEIFQCFFNPELNGFQIIGSRGLRRKAIAGSSFSAPGSGTAMFAPGGSYAGETTTAEHNWMTGGKTIESGTELIIDYFTDESAWVITAAGC